MTDPKQPPAFNYTQPEGSSTQYGGFDYSGTSYGAPQVTTTTTTTSSFSTGNANITGPAYPPPPPGYTQNNIIVTQPGVFVHLLRRDPAAVMCHRCNRQIVTKVKYDISSNTWCVVGLLCLAGAGIFAFIPLCMKSCKRATHTCPYCLQVLGVHNGGL